MNFVKFLRTTILLEHLWSLVAASDVLQICLTRFHTSEITEKYEERVKYLSILHEVSVRQLVYH